MKVYFLLLVVAILVPHAINANPSRSENIEVDCTEYDDGEVLPDGTSCSRYYICVGGRALRKQCARGLYFDAQGGMCNMAFLVDCLINRYGNIHQEHGSNDAGKNKAADEEPCDDAKAIVTPTPTTPAPCSESATTSSKTTTTKTTTTKTTTTKTTTTKTTTCTTTKVTTACSATPSSTCSTTTCSTTTCSTTAAPCSDTPAGSKNNGTDTHNNGTDTTSVKVLKSNKDCETLPDGTYLTNDKHCRRYYICSNKRAKRARCSKLNDWFDPKTKTCRPRSDVECSANRN